MFSVLSAPLIPSSSFAVWVRLWVKYRNRAAGGLSQWQGKCINKKAISSSLSNTLALYSTV